MALSLGNVTIVASGGSYTVPSGANPILYAMQTGSDTGNGPTAVAYNGVAMTRVILLSAPSAGIGSPGVYVWELANPPQGVSHALTVTTAVAAGNFVCATYLGNVGMFPIFQHIQGTGDGSPVSLSITPDTTGSWLVALGDNLAGTNPTLTGASMTMRQQSGGQFWWDSNAAPGGSLQTVNFPTTNLQPYSYALILLTPQIARTLTAASGSFALTGIAATILQGIARFLVAAHGSFSVTGIGAIFTLFRLWINQSKNTNTFTNQTPHTGNSWQNDTKHTDSFTNQPKP